MCVSQLRKTVPCPAPTHTCRQTLVVTRAVRACLLLLCSFQTGHSHMALLLQKQEDQGTDKEAAGTLPLTAIVTCSSSSEGGTTPTGQQHAPHGSSGSTPAGGKPNRVASLIRSISGKTFGRSNSKKRAGSGADVGASLPEPQQHTAVEISPVDPLSSNGRGPAGVVNAADINLLEAGGAAAGSPHSQLRELPPHTPHEPPARMPHCAIAPGQIGGRPSSAPGAAAAAAAAGNGGLLRGSGGALGRPSAAAVWQEAGWDAAAGVPVGIITLEDVLEELMQVCRHTAHMYRQDGRAGTRLLWAGCQLTGCCPRANREVVSRSLSEGRKRQDGRRTCVREWSSVFSACRCAAKTLDRPHPVLPRLRCPPCLACLGIYPTQEEIVDETDAFIDNEKTCRVNARVLAGSLPPGLRRLLVTSQQRQLQRQLHHQQGGAAAAPLATHGSSPALSGGGAGAPSAVIVSTGGGGQVTVVSTGTSLGQVAMVRTSQTGSTQAHGSISGPGDAAGAQPSVRGVGAGAGS